MRGEAERKMMKNSSHSHFFNQTEDDELPPLHGHSTRDPGWMNIDPLTSLNAKNITTWMQSYEIKMLVKNKLEHHGYLYEGCIQENLINLIKLKQKNEKQQNLLRKEGEPVQNKLSSNL